MRNITKHPKGCKSPSAYRQEEAVRFDRYCEAVDALRSLFRTIPLDVLEAIEDACKTELLRRRGAR